MHGEGNDKWGVLIIYTVAIVLSFKIFLLEYFQKEQENIMDDQRTTDGDLGGTKTYKTIFKRKSRTS